MIAKGGLGVEFHVGALHRWLEFFRGGYVFEAPDEWDHDRPADRGNIGM